MRRTLFVLVYMLIGLSLVATVWAASGPNAPITSVMAVCTPDFIRPPTSPVAVGDEPFYMATGDFNQDGKPDLAVANSNQSNVTILLGDGMGNFTTPATSPETVGDGPVSIAVADFNGDTKLDLAVGKFGGQSVTILLGNGLGDFTEAPNSPKTLPGVAQSVMAADLNNDGKVDLAIAVFRPTVNVAVILLGDGTGDFTEPASSPEATGTVPYAIAVGHFNADSHLDLAVANQDASNVTILLGNGAGDFTEAATSPESVGFGPTHVVTADFNSDGKLDLAVSTQLDDKVTILLGNGLGDFTAPATSPESVGDLPFYIAVADYNQDGLPDLAVANRGNARVSILLGAGGGDFTAPPTSPEIVNGGPYSVVTADFNLDGLPDLATSNNVSDNVTILLNTCLSATKPAVARLGAWHLRNSLTSGVADLVFSFGLPTDRPLMCDWDGNGSKTPGVFRNGTWYLRNANSAGPADLSFGFGLTSDTPVCGDWNGDGVDTIGVVRATTWYLRNANSAGAANLTFSYGVLGDSPVVGDWNGDQVDTVGIKRGNQWHLRNSNTAGIADLIFVYGLATDSPVVGDWNADVVDTVGVTRGGQWLLRNSNTAGPADLSFLYGIGGDIPLAWR